MTSVAIVPAPNPATAWSYPMRYTRTRTRIWIRMRGEEYEVINFFCNAKRGARLGRTVGMTYDGSVPEQGWVLNVRQPSRDRRSRRRVRFTRRAGRTCCGGSHIVALDIETWSSGTGSGRPIVDSSFFPLCACGSRCVVGRLDFHCVMVCGQCPSLTIRFNVLCSILFYVVWVVSGSGRCGR